MGFSKCPFFDINIGMDVKCLLFGLNKKGAVEAFIGGYI
jgi:hypothetical protein